MAPERYRSPDGQRNDAGGPIAGSTAGAIAASAEAAIRDGRLAPGERLPPIRALAAELGTSPATVAAAYKALGHRGLAIGEGRRGTRVAPRPAVALRGPAAAAADDASAAGLRDLAHGGPDPALLPPLPAASTAGLPTRAGENDPELLAFAARAFAADGCPAGPVAVVSGALDGVERALQAHLRPGDRVAVEDPGFPPFRDLLAALALRPEPFGIDEEGPLPERFAQALARGARAALVVPRAQNPTGAMLTPGRARELRAILARHPEVLLIEDDHAGPVAGPRAGPLADPARSRWAVVRSVSKTLHPDLRLAVMTGDEVTLGRLEGRQQCGAGWVSHLLQRTVAALWGDPATRERIAAAASAYAERRGALMQALAAHGIAAHARSGLNVWVPVPEEAAAVRAAREAGFAVLAGERFRHRSPPAVRVTISTLDPHRDAAPLAAALLAARRPRRGY